MDKIFMNCIIAALNYNYCRTKNNFKAKIVMETPKSIKNFALKNFRLYSICTS